MRSSAFLILLFAILAACGGSAPAARKPDPPRTALVTPNQRVPVPSGWKDEINAESTLIGVPCDVRLVSPKPDTEICIKVADARLADPFIELTPEKRAEARANFEKDGWSDVEVPYDPARKMMGYAGTKVVALREGATPANWRVRWMRADLSGDPAFALMLLAVAPAANAAELDAAVRAIDASLALPPSAAPAP